MPAPADFEAFASLLREMSPHEEYSQWPDRPDLPDSVRAFWGAVGIPESSSSVVPRASREEDEAVLAGVFERWFDDAATRDRWAVEPEDEPIPWRRLPPTPRVVSDQGKRVLMVSDVGPEPSLHIFWQTYCGSEQPPFAYLFWCMRQLLQSAVAPNCAGHLLERELGEPLLPELGIGVRKVANGIYLRSMLVKGEGNECVFSDVDTYTDFVMSLSPDERECFDEPEGLRIEAQLSKKQRLYPGLKQVDPNFIHLSRIKQLAGRVEGHWVWSRSNGPPRNVAIRCDPTAEQVVKTWLENGGAKVTDVRVTSRALMTYW